MNALAAPDAFSRCVPLERGFNMRDFGGYPAMDGRRVATGKLYRSGTMTMLSDADAAHLRALGIDWICDLRRTNERTAEPTRWHEGSVTELWARDHAAHSGALTEVLNDPAALRGDVFGLMLQIYRDIAADHAESYRELFDRLAAGRVPMLVNCSAGKDRTGVAAALVLCVLGVPRETIMADYLLTNELADWDRLRELGAPMMQRFNLDRRDVLAPVLTVHPDYLETFYAALDTGHGGVEGYVRDTLGIDDAQIGAIRDNLLTDD